MSSIGMQKLGARLVLVDNVGSPGLLFELLHAHFPKKDKKKKKIVRSNIASIWNSDISVLWTSPHNKHMGETT